MINLILCGGSGTRLWPVSRSLMPKQFAPLFDGQSLFRKTVVTNSAVCESQFIVSNADQYFLAKDQLEMDGMTGSRFLLEPVGRNTAPAIALACLTMKPETIVLVSPSDHVIRKKDEYKKVLLCAQELAEAGNLVTFGITPTTPETGYGYIEADGENVKRFSEKICIRTGISAICSFFAHLQRNHVDSADRICLHIFKITATIDNKSAISDLQCRKHSFILKL